MPAGQVYEVRVLYYVGNSPCSNQWFLREVEGTSNDDRCEAVADSFWTKWKPFYRALLCNTTEITQVRVRDLGPNTRRRPAQLLLPPDKGTRGGVPLPANCNIQFAYLGSSSQTRRPSLVKIAGISESDTDEDRVTSGYQTAIDNFVANALDSIPETSAGNGVWRLQQRSESNANGGSPANPVFLPVGAAKMSTVIFGLSSRRTGYRGLVETAQ